MVMGKTIIPTPYISNRIITATIGKIILVYDFWTVILVLEISDTLPPGNNFIVYTKRRHIIALAVSSYVQPCCFVKRALSLSHLWAGGLDNIPATYGGYINKFLGIVCPY